MKRERIKYLPQQMNLFKLIPMNRPEDKAMQITYALGVILIIILSIVVFIYLLYKFAAN
tara:strand:- start:408 stop:584 length:177 start_codon:yes stop_codon:yes gene_type:complete